MHDGQKYKVREVKSLKAVGALVTSEANSMSLQRFRMRLADEAMWADVGFYKDKGISEQNKHGRYWALLQACVLHSNEGLIRTKGRKRTSQDEEDEKRKTEVLKGRDKLRRRDLCWEQTRVQILDDSMLIVNWMNGR